MGPVDGHLRRGRLHVRLYDGATTGTMHRSRRDKDRLDALALARLRGVYSDNLIELVQWCMELDPLARPQSVFAFHKALEP